MGPFRDHGSGAKACRLPYGSSLRRFLYLLSILAGTILALPNDLAATDPDRPAPSITMQRIDSDSIHTCALDHEGQAYCWGAGDRGRLGNGSTDEQPLPVQVEQGELRFVSIGVGIAHSCALTDTGAVYCWGAGNLGRLGNGGSPVRSTPVPVSGDYRFVQLTVSRVSSCGLTESGQAYCWGYNNMGQLGDGTTETRSVPTPVSGGLTFRQLSAGRSHTCGITTAGEAYCWGSQIWGRLGNGEVGSGRVLNPAPVQGSETFAQISAGSLHTCAITTTGQTYCWGRKTFGRLGDGVNDDEKAAAAPLLVVGSHEFRMVSAGNLHTCALTTNGQAYCWGSQARGKLGNGQTRAGTIDGPAEVTNGSDFVEVVTAIDHSCGITAGGIIYCWGNGASHRLGNGSTSRRGIPIPVPGLRGSEVTLTRGTTWSQ